MDERSMHVFFYGLFMDASLLASKNVRPTETAVGYVDGFGLHIGERATLLPESGARSYGVLAEINAAETASLYSDPSVADYVAEPIVVILPGDARVSAACYNLPQAKLAGTNPAYAATLLALAESLGFPDSYLDRIRAAAEAN